MLALKTDTPSLRLLADETAKVLNGIACVLDGLALLVDAPGRTPAEYRGVLPGVADWLPAVVNGARAFVTIGAVELLWVATAWPNGGSAIVFVAIVVLLLSPKGDLAYLGAIAFALAAALGIVVAAIMKFAVSAGIRNVSRPSAPPLALFFIPVGFAMARSRTPALMAVFSAMAVDVMRLLSPTNPMIYDTAQFYNTALAIVVGCAVAPLAFRLLPPLSPALRARRLLALTLRDLRRLAISPLPPRSEDWERRMYDRLAALPDEAEPLQRSQLLAALSVGTRHHSPSPPGSAPWGDHGARRRARVPSRRETARSPSRGCINLDHRLASDPDAGTGDRRSRFGRAAASWPSPKRLPSTAHTSTRERPHEVRRDRPVRCLRCADLAHYGRRLVRHDRTAPRRQPLRLAAIRLASGSVRVCRVHHRSLVLDPDHRRAELVMTATEVASKRGKTARSDAETPVSHAGSAPHQACR